ncbi:MAG: hypothetical protein LQ352_004157 [Teloschistes flavicans]|nr:MAG: hypothetical protein LQ352_004157 [Teloschistes flavicans]
MTTDPRFAANPCILKNADKDQHLANFYELAAQVINIQYACGRADEAWYAKGSEKIQVEFEKLARKMEAWEDNMDHFHQYHKDTQHLQTLSALLDRASRLIIQDPSRERDEKNFLRTIVSLTVKVQDWEKDHEAASKCLSLHLAPLFGRD